MFPLLKIAYGAVASGAKSPKYQNITLAPKLFCIEMTFDSLQFLRQPLTPFQHTGPLKVRKNFGLFFSSTENVLRQTYFTALPKWQNVRAGYMAPIVP